MKLTCVVGARPNIIKIAAIMRAARSRPSIRTRLIHTGQHYEPALSAQLFSELGLAPPDSDFAVGSASHAVQTGRIMSAFDAELDHYPADCVLVVGDVNSTLACALVAVKRGVAVAHVEAGLRSGDRSMPEEINRVLTDQIATYLFTTEPGAMDNLVREGVDPARIHFVGNVMIDTLLSSREKARSRNILDRLHIVPRRYGLCTIHRPSNVDTVADAINTIRAVEALTARMTVVFPMHPRTRARLAEFGLLERLQALDVRAIEPLGYLDFLALMDQARLVFTDSGGVQEETTALGVPCLTFRETTERPVTATVGTNIVGGVDPGRIAVMIDRLLTSASLPQAVPELWDGRAGSRILAILDSTAPEASGAGLIERAVHTV